MHIQSKMKTKTKSKTTTTTKLISCLAKRTIDLLMRLFQQAKQNGLIKYDCMKGD